MSTTSWLVALACVLSAVPAGAQVHPVRLLDEAVVKGGTVRLADLLPLDASPALRSSAGKISLAGRRSLEVSEYSARNNCRM
jgi:hypothetical protein